MINLLNGIVCFSLCPRRQINAVWPDQKLCLVSGGASPSPTPLLALVVPWMGFGGQAESFLMAGRKQCGKPTPLLLTFLLTHCVRQPQGLSLTEVAPPLLPPEWE